MNPRCSIKGRPATVWRRTGTRASLAAIIPNKPALGVWVCTIAGCSFANNRYNRHRAFRSLMGVMARVMVTAVVRTPSACRTSSNI
nr:hypothetical protein [Paraflavitalea speifideiaquila]